MSRRRWGRRCYATSGGVVTSAAPGGAYGNLLKITHAGGVETWYAHLSTVELPVGSVVRPGQAVARGRGDRAGLWGAPAPRGDGVSGVAVDPEVWLAARGLAP
ncbi:MAG: M23 family metallopeptidase [Nocardioidaceae bacterium]